jgi:hypothetical protein
VTTSLVRFVGGLFLIAATIGSGAAIGIGALSAGPAGAVTSPLVVDNNVDSAATPSNCTTPVVGECTLRDAVAAASAAGGAVTITLPSLGAGDVYNVDSTLGYIDVSGGGTVTIVGGGQSNTILEATNAGSTPTTRVLKVENGTIADISGVTIEDGVGNVGGGILVCGTLSLSDSTVTLNHAIVTGGGVELSSNGSATLTDDTISDNVSGGNGNDSGGGIAVENASASATSNLTLEGTTVTANNASDQPGGNGGGILAFNTSGAGLDPNLTVDIDNSTISNNTISQDSVFGAGIAVEDGSWTVTNSTIAGNQDGGNDMSGGGAFIDAPGLTETFTNVTINGNTATVNGGGVFIEGGSNTFTDETINGNTAASSGGGVFIEGGTNTFSGGSVNGNSAGISGFEVGGGIEVAGGTNTFSSQTISDNSAGVGGGISYGGFGDSITNETISDNSAAFGASAVYVNTSGLSITASTISGNTTPGPGGGGIVNDGCNALTLTNDTIANNTATASTTNYPVGGYLGVDCGVSHIPAVRSVSWARVGGVRAQVPATEGTFLFDTIDGNTAVASGGGGNISQEDSSVISLAETIVAGGISGGSAANCFVGNPSTFTSGGYNLIADSTCGTAAATEIIGQSPQLGSLGNNGGPTQTELPGSTSPAISAIPAAVCSGTGVTTDQRGNARGAGTNGSCTIGSVEVAQAFNPNGYRMVADEGGIFDFGLNFNGSLANNKLNAPIVGIANSPGPNGYLMVGSDGGVFALGGANFYGSLCCNPLPSPIAAIAATPREDGYWLAAQNGKISNFGNTPALLSVQVPSGAHIVGMASTIDGKGLWLTDNLGDVYAVGDALYLGGMGGIHLNAPVVGIAAAASGQGYVLAASDGGTFNFGVGFFGSVPGSLAPGQHLVAPIIGIAVTHSGNGYWMVGADGGLFNYGDAPFLGSIYTAIDGTPLNGPIVGIQHLGAAPV